MPATRRARPVVAVATVPPRETRAMAKLKKAAAAAPAPAKTTAPKRQLPARAAATKRKRDDSDETAVEEIATFATVQKRKKVTAVASAAPRARSTRADEIKAARIQRELAAKEEQIRRREQAHLKAAIRQAKAAKDAEEAASKAARPIAAVDKGKGKLARKFPARRSKKAAFVGTNITPPKQVKTSRWAHLGPSKEPLGTLKVFPPPATVIYQRPHRLSPLPTPPPRPMYKADPNNHRLEWKRTKTPQTEASMKMMLELGYRWDEQESGYYRSESGKGRPRE